MIQILTHKHTTVCVTKAGYVYAVGDKFAKHNGIKNEKFGFYKLQVAENENPLLP